LPEKLPEKGKVNNITNDDNVNRRRTRIDIEHKKIDFERDSCTDKKLLELFQRLSDWPIHRPMIARTQVFD